MRYSNEPRDQNNARSCGVLSFTKNLRTSLSSIDKNSVADALELTEKEWSKNGKKQQVTWFEIKF